MNRAEIVTQIKAALTEAGITPTSSDYDDSGSLVTVDPTDNWIDGLNGSCFVCIYEDRVLKWQRNTPYNYTRGYVVGAPIAYATVEEMTTAVRRLQRAPKAACWNP